MIRIIRTETSPQRFPKKPFKFIEDSINMQLSERRAKSVSGYLESKGIPFDRFTIKWYGETQPKYPNDNDVDRSKNRRVELAIYANDKMKQEAQQGDLPQ